MQMPLEPAPTPEQTSVPMMEFSPTHSPTLDKADEYISPSNATYPDDSPYSMPEEVPIKQYNIAELRNWLRIGRTTGQMEVTSRRLIFTAKGRGTSNRGAIHKEFALDDISGIGFTGNYRFSAPHFMLGIISVFIVAVLMAVATFMGGWAITTLFETTQPILDFMRHSIDLVLDNQVVEVKQLSLILGLFAGFGGVTLYFLLRKRFWFRLMMLGVSFGAFFVVSLTGNTFSFVLLGLAGLICMYGLVMFAVLPDLIVTVYGKGGACVDIVRGKSYMAGVLGRTAGYAEAASTMETYTAISEVGTIIADIQNHGDAGVNKWSM